MYCWSVEEVGRSSPSIPSIDRVLYYSRGLEGNTAGLPDLGEREGLSWNEQAKQTPLSLSGEEKRATLTFQKIMFPQDREVYLQLSLSLVCVVGEQDSPAGTPFLKHVQTLQHEPRDDFSFTLFSGHVSTSGLHTVFSLLEERSTFKSINS